MIAVGLCGVCQEESQSLWWPFHSPAPAIIGPIPVHGDMLPSKGSIAVGWLRSTVAGHNHGDHLGPSQPDTYGAYDPHVCSFEPRSDLALHPATSECSEKMDAGSTAESLESRTASNSWCHGGPSQRMRKYESCPDTHAARPMTKPASALHPIPQARRRGRDNSPDMVTRSQQRGLASE